MLVLTLLTMTLCTGLIGVLPSSDTIGVWAPALLIALRMVQGLALGGEWGGAALMAVEHAPPGRRGFHGATMQMGVPAGLLLSTGAFSLASALPDSSFYAWGWRIPFLVSFVLAGIGLYVRLSVTEPLAFQNVEHSGGRPRLPILEVLTHEKRKTLVLVFLQTACNVGCFMVSVYSLTYLTNTLHVPRSWAVNGLLLAAAVDLVTQPLFGKLSDRIGRRKVYALGAVFFGLYAFPFFALLDHGSKTTVFIAMILGLGIGHAATGSLNAVVYAEQYPARYRCTGASTAYQFAGVISSGPTPIIAAWLVTTTGTSKYVAGYVVLAAVITLICTLLIKETYREPIDT